MSHSRATFAVGLVALLLAAGASAALVALAADLAALPGCGPASACARATAGAWGRLPVLGWPTSHVGLAYFVAWALAWVATRGVPGARLRTLARVGLLISVLLCGVLVAERALCPYCLSVHAANLVFVVALELGARGAPGTPLRGALPFGAAFVGATVLLVVSERRQAEERTAEAERALVASTEEVLERADHASGAGEEPFTGRYRLGPEAASVRIVAFTDYQCPDCRRVEGELQAALARHPGVSFSAKHFPFCSDCNEVARAASYSPHPNACLAAQAAEAAGLLGGNDAFWATHRWLFERKGSFREDELLAFVAGLGLDARAFREAWRGEDVLARIRADVAEGAALGLRSTPLVFLNGVELRGWQTPGAVGRAIEALVARGLPAATAQADRPPRAVDKYVEDWRASPRRALRASPHVHWRSSGTGPTRVDVVLWGDYQEPGTRALARALTDALAERDGVRYAFRHYPLDRDCNPHATRTRHPDACRAALAAEAAGRLGGEGGFWNMHRALIAGERFDEPAVRALAGEQGLDSEALLEAMRDPACGDAIESDAAEARRLGLRGVPFLWIAGRRVPRWRLEDQPVLERILDAALAE